MFCCFFFDLKLDSNTIRQNWINLTSQVFSVRENGKSNTSIRVYPNPAHENTSIDLDNLKNDGTVKLSVLDLTGATVYVKNNVLGSSGMVNVNTVDLPAGIYMVKAESDTKISTQKLVIRR
ncbi:MAG: T9SS type A sorting domain-containing protein [Bacteroidales bacterium]|nr:T9SS type A sorting domain-containing protein [Bacteroidales bacterium]